MDCPDFLQTEAKLLHDTIHVGAVPTRSWSHRAWNIARADFGLSWGSTMAQSEPAQSITRSPTCCHCRYGGELCSWSSMTYNGAVLIHGIAVCDDNDLIKLKWTGPSQIGCQHA